MNIVILAGGQGTRLWPMSRKDKPKQFYAVLSRLPMIAEVYERLAERFSPQHIYISTHERFAPLISELIPAMQDSQYLLETSKRDSGPAMALAAWRLTEQGKGDEPFVFIPTDHFIADSERFLDTLEKGGRLVEATGSMVDISVTPEFASTTLGYTQIGELLEEEDGIEVYAFLGHKEKPDHATARQYVASGEYLWHANYYMWTPKALLEAYQKHAPEIYEKLESMAEAPPDLAAQIYETMPSVSIDYAVTEKIDPSRVRIIRGDFGWSDIGAWDVLHDRLRQSEGDEQLNVTKGHVMAMDTNNSLIYSTEKKIIATIGLNDMVVVDTGDALLICPRGRAQDVKKLTSLLDERGFEHYL